MPQKLKMVVWEQVIFLKKKRSKKVSVSGDLCVEFTLWDKLTT